MVIEEQTHDIALVYAGMLVVLLCLAAGFWQYGHRAAAGAFAVAALLLSGGFMVFANSRISG